VHDEAHVRVDLRDAGIVTEFGGDVDRLEHLGDDLGGQRHVDRHDNAQPERETERDRQYVGPEQLVLQLGQPKCVPRSSTFSRHSRHLAFR